MIATMATDEQKVEFHSTIEAYVTTYSPEDSPLMLYVFYAPLTSEQTNIGTAAGELGRRLKPRNKYNLKFIASHIKYEEGEYRLYYICDVSLVDEIGVHMFSMLIDREKFEQQLHAIHTPKLEIAQCA